MANCPLLYLSLYSYLLTFQILADPQGHKFVMPNIKGLKPDLISEEPSQEADITKHWRDLLPLLKSPGTDDTTITRNPKQQKQQSIPNINWDTVTKFFNPNASSIIVPYLSSSLDPHITYRVCKQCGRPIAVDAILDHIKMYCPNKSSDDGQTVKIEDDKGNVKGNERIPTISESPTEVNIKIEKEEGRKQKGATDSRADERLPDTNDDKTHSRKRARSEDDGDDEGNSEEGEEEKEKANKEDDGDGDDPGSPGEVVMHTTGKVTGDKRPPPPYDTNDSSASKQLPPETMTTTTAAGVQNDKSSIKNEPVQKKQRTSVSNGSTASTPGSSATPGTIAKRKDRIIKQRNPTEKHLIDFDKQCGVSLPEGGYCARSLTCKSHSMGAKRAVPGRTRPFDELLAEYHREHQTKIGAAAEKRAKQQELLRQQKQQLKEQKLQKKLLLQKQRQMQRQNKLKEKSGGAQGGGSGSGNSSGKNRRGNAAGDKGATGPDSGMQGVMGRDGGSSSAYGLNAQGNRSLTGTAGAVSSTPEEETTQVLNGVSRSFPLPLDSTVPYSTRIRTKYMRLREMFASAFPVKQGYSSPGIGAIHSRVGYFDIDRASDSKLRVRVPQPLNPMNVGQNLSPQQLRRMRQQQMMMQGQMANRQYVANTQVLQQQQQQQQHLGQPQQPQQQQIKPRLQVQVPQSASNAGPSNSTAVGTTGTPIKRPETPSNSEGQGLTPREIQQQQSKLRQQQIQQQRFESAAFQLANTSKLISNPGVGSSSGQGLDMVANNIHPSVGFGMPNANLTMVNTGGDSRIGTDSRSNSNNVNMPMDGHTKQLVGMPASSMTNTIGVGGQVNTSSNEVS